MMRVLLPPSETKTSGGGNTLLKLESLAFPDRLTESRKKVIAALEALCADPERAAKQLKLGVRASGEIELNTRLYSSATLPAIERYTGVLYDALKYQGVDPAGQVWINEHVFIQSALFGLLRAGDLIPQYRLSASANLSSEGIALKGFWRDSHGKHLLEDNLIVDMRSKDYAALAPIPDALYLEVKTRTHEGETRALNHFNKAAKGDLVSRMAESRLQAGTVAELLVWADRQGLEMHSDGDALTLVTELGAPSAA